MLEQFIDELVTAWDLVSRELQQLRDENARLRAKLEDLFVELEEIRSSALVDHQALQKLEQERVELLSRVRKVRDQLAVLEKPGATGHGSVQR